MKKTRSDFFKVASATAGTLAIHIPASAAQFDYKLGHDQPASHPLNVSAMEFATAVEKQTNGRLRVRVFPDSSLGSDPAMVVQAQTGALEMHLQGAGPLS